MYIVNGKQYTLDELTKFVQEEQNNNRLKIGDCLLLPAIVVDILNNDTSNGEVIAQIAFEDTTAVTLNIRIVTLESAKTQCTNYHRYLHNQYFSKTPFPRVPEVKKPDLSNSDFIVSQSGNTWMIYRKEDGRYIETFYSEQAALDFIGVEVK